MNRLMNSVFLTNSKENTEKNERMLQKCYKNYKKVLINVKNVLK